MDINTALGNARLTAALIRQAIDAGNPVDPDMVNDLVEAFDAVDGWLSRGGFLPQDWQANR